MFRIKFMVILPLFLMAHMTSAGNVSDLIDFKTCRNELLKFRNHTINANRYAEDLFEKRRPVNKETCEHLDYLNKLSQKMGDNNLDLKYYTCVQDVNGTYHITETAALYASLVERGDRPNMAAIGWTQANDEISYKCGGSVVTERFIVTAAHCKYFNGLLPDTVRIGDRFLITSEDDDIAQQLKIDKFISHPDYRSRYKYNDIAMIKTVGEIFFNKFVVPACIDDLNSERIGFFTDWTVAGYGETEDRVPSNVLLELKVDLVSNAECNETYKDEPALPNGIIDSQFCVKSQGRYEERTPDTCFGDSGSPLQFKSSHEVFPDDFKETSVSNIYTTSTVLGIVSFGMDCGHDIPSVYTKLEYYKDWMKSVMKNQ